MRKTEKELLSIKKQNVFIFEKQILQGKIPLEDISQQFSGIVHLNNMNTFAWDWIPKKIINQFDIDVEEESKWTLEKFALKHIHPLSIQKLAPLYFRALKNKSSEPLSTVQYVKVNDQLDYAWVHKTCVFSFELGKIVSISHFIKGLESELDKENKLLGEYDFIRTSYEKFMTLTNRQRQILKLLALGYMNDAIAVELNISSNTVRTHRNEIHQILDLRWKNVNHSQIYLKYAFHFGLV